MGLGFVALATGKPSPLFVYEEGGDTFSFFSPKTVRIVRAAGTPSAHAYQYELPETGNMLSGRNVESALRDPVVQSELHAQHAYSAPDASKLSAGVDAVNWSAATCRGTCSPEPPRMRDFHAMLRTVMRNARLVCP